MTPNPDLYKVLKEALSETIAHAILDGQNQIHDLKAGIATPDEVSQRMQASHDFHLKQFLLTVPFLEGLFK